MITIEYDKKADAAYVYLIDKEKVQPGWAKKTYPCDPSEVEGMINLDFDIDGHLGGIEILDASKKLSHEVLSQAKIIGDGGAIDALQHYFLTGDTIKGSTHLQKVKDAVRGLGNLLNGNTLNSIDRSKAEFLFNKATEVLRGGGEL